MDPYIEAQGNWQDFHNSLIGEIRSALGQCLPDSYVARMDERIDLLGVDEEGTTFDAGSYRPDVLLARREGPTLDVEPGNGGVATLAPATVEVLARDPEEIRQTWLEIRRLPDLQLVTVIEVLSPANKGPARSIYLDKRQALFDQRVNLVEIDLLLGGSPVPMKGAAVGGAYYALVARGPELPRAQAYRWTVRDRLPAIPIPLRAPDPDVLIDQAEPVKRVYDLGRYARTLRHDTPLPDAVRLVPEDREWVEKHRAEMR
jgi:hypothetical protein